MAVADHSIDPRIIKSARAEFLEKGFEKASLKAICEGAGVTTGALYKRYKGKEDLFSAVVENTVDELYEVAKKRSAVDPSELSDKELIDCWDMYNNGMLWWFEYLYERYDDFVLLLKCSEGTKYSKFKHDWAEMLTKASMEYLEEAQKRGLCRKDIKKEELHILLTSFWEGIYEPFVHGFTWDQIELHSEIMCDLFNWHKAMGFS